MRSPQDRDEQTIRTVLFVFAVSVAVLLLYLGLAAIGLVR